MVFQGEFLSSKATGLLTTFIVKKALPALEQDLQAQKFTVKASIPAGQGLVGRINQYSSPVMGTSGALTEGSTGNWVDVTVSPVNITISEIGEAMHIPTIMDIAASAGMRQDLVDRFAFGGKLKIDTLVLAQFYANATTIMQCLGTTAGAVAYPNAAVPTGMNATAIIAAKKKLKDAYSQGFTNVAGIPSGHMAVMLSEQAEVDMVTEVSAGRVCWAAAKTNVPGYQGQESWVNGYIGSVYGVACVTSQNVTTGQTISGTNSSANIVTAYGAVGAVAFGDMNMSVYINTPNANSTDNPYRNFSTVAWYGMFGTKLLDVNRTVKLYSAGS